LATLDFSSDHRGTISVSLMDTKGKLIWQKKYVVVAGMNMLQLGNLQTLPNGIYTVHVFDGTHAENVKLLIRH
jgi:hypothetical protein